jgi:hypothetical protein
VVNISLISSTYFMWNMVLYMRGCRFIHPNQTGLLKKNHTLTDLVNSMLDTAGLAMAWCGRIY